MIQLVYESVARPGLSAGDFEALLASGRARNRAAGLTSMLVYDGRRFLQAIEGDDGIVEQCFGRIALDPRHRDLDIKALHRIQSPQFGSWDLQLHRIDEPSNLSAIGAIDVLARDLSAATVRDLLLDFCGLARKRA